MSSTSQSTKVRAEDHARVREIVADCGVSITDAIGLALEGWSLLTDRQKQRVIRGRARRRAGIEQTIPHPAVTSIEKPQEEFAAADVLG